MRKKSGHQNLQKLLHAISNEVGASPNRWYEFVPGMARQWCIKMGPTSRHPVILEWGNGDVEIGNLPIIIRLTPTMMTGWDVEAIQSMKRLCVAKLREYDPVLRHQAA